MAMRYLKKIVNEFAPPQEKPQLKMTMKELMGKVAEFSRLGESLYKTKKMAELANELEELATHAEAYALKEDEGEWFDNVTIKRNMNELKKYVSEFKKIATECDRMNQRATALYEDMGRVLGRYYEIKDLQDGLGKDIGAPVFKTPGKISADKVAQFLKKHNIEAKTIKMGSNYIIYVVNTDDEFKAKSVLRKIYPLKDYVDTFASRTIPADEAEKTVKNQPMYEHMNKQIISVTSKLRKLHLQEIYFNLNKAKMNPDERQAMEDKVKKNRRLAEQITITFMDKLMKEVNDDFPTGDWTHLSVPKFCGHDDVEGFLAELKDEGFKIKCKVWEERSPRGPNMFISFYVPKDQFNEANALAVKLAPSYQK